MTDNVVRERHGSPIFYKLLDEMADTHDKKSHDYANNSDPYGNYEFAGKLSVMFAHSPEDAGFVGRIGEKLYRLANLERDKKNPKNESIEDTERDLCVIMALWVASRRDRRNNIKISHTTAMYQCRRCSAQFSYEPIIADLPITNLEKEATRVTRKIAYFCSEYCKNIFIGTQTTGRPNPLNPEQESTKQHP